MRAGVLAVVGCVIGLVAKLGDEHISGAFALVFSGPAPYAAGVAFIGWFARSPLRAALEAAAFFLGLCLTYYATAAWIFGFPVALDAAFWILLAVTACPLGCAVLRWCRRSRWNWIALGGVAFFALGVGATRLYTLLRHDVGRNDVVLASLIEVTIGVAVVALARRPLPMLGAAVVSVGAGSVMAVLQIDLWAPLLWFLQAAR